MVQVQVPLPPPQQQQQQIGGANGSPTVQAACAGAAGANQFLTTSLYVGDLEVNLMDNQLYDLFSQVAQVVSVRVYRDITTSRSLGYAYVNFNSPMDAARALEMLNYTPFNKKPIRIMYSNRDPSAHRSGAANIFINNLDKGINNKALHDTFSAFGNILSCKVVTDPSGQSKGYGFVQYEQEEAAEIAINKLNGMLLNEKLVIVGPFLRKQERDNSVNKSVFSNVFVKISRKLQLKKIWKKFLANMKR
ncbi:polyadenylate-binding protein 2-like [Iris pallida]|uniref:Polyadenylate-binding protein 2-like n=1 Tax=Iris pallida TaxID=29817 RepID=A0AAX6I8F6_IRIPA|nr:polyadenylate-binding protein 2-like [Iris pallida]